MKLLLVFALALPAAAQIGRPDIKNRPVTLVQQSTLTRTLPDGSHITTTNTETYYRNAQGLIRTDFVSPLTGPRHGAMHLSRITSLDSTEVTQWIIYDDRPEANSITRETWHTAGGSTYESKVETKREDLGPSEVNGNACDRRRSTTTYPVGFHGNDRPYSVTEEECVSRDYGTLSFIVDNPLGGRHVVTTQSLTPGEPDAAVFQPPADMQAKLRAQNP